MDVVFEGDVGVHYGFVYLDSGVGGWDPDVEARAGQRNGLLGAAQPGLLVMSTGMHTGLVPFRVEAHPVAPAVDRSYEEIVEASCQLRGPEVWLCAFDWATGFALPQAGSHRARLSARDYGAGLEQERYEPQDPVRDSYLLQLWPAPAAPDDVIRVTSQHAAYWHGVAREHPGAAPSPHEQALAQQHELDAAARRLHEQERHWYLQRWGGRDPSPRLLQVEQHAMALTRERRDLVDANEALTPEGQGRLALGLARSACVAADGLLDWRPALDALSAGRPLPAPFDDEQAIHRRLFADQETAVVAVATWSAPGAPWPPLREPLHHGVTAAAVVLAAAAADPLESSLRAVEAASWSAPDLDAYFDAVARTLAGR